MKKGILFIFLFCILTATAQVDTSKIKMDTAALESILRPDSTAIGTPMGSYSSEEIGPEGGRVVSGDGKVELIFPNGALTQKTTIGIQTTQNMLDSTKLAYQLEPSGTQFNKPVKIIFHYTDEEAEECPPDLKSFALQDHHGKWTYLEYEDWDSAGKTLTGFIQHFSTVVTDENDVTLRPDKAWISLNSFTSIHLLHKRVIMSGFRLGQNDTPEFASEKIGFFVNGIPGGNAKEGTGEMMNNWLGDYQSPDVFPTKNPVQIKVAFKYYSKKQKKPAWGTATCSIMLWDAYQLSVWHTFPSRAGMNGSLSDHATCMIYVSPKGVFISKIENFSPVVLKDGKHPPFEEKLYGDNAEGKIQLTEKINMPREMNKSFPKEIYFDFVSVPVVEFYFKTGSHGKWTDIEPLKTMSYPLNVWFLANGQTQHFTSTLSKEEHYEETITPLRDK